MKCPNCGAPLKMEDKFCSYCGAPNTLALKHQAEVEQFEREFSQTRQEVLRETRKAGSFTGMLVVLIIMLLLNIVAGIVSANAWSIRYDWDKKRANSRMEEYKADMEAMIADQDYISISHYYYQSGMTDADTENEYTAIVRYASNLATLYDYLCDMEGYSFISNNLARSAEYMAGDLISLYEDPRGSYFSDDAITDDKLAVIEDIQRQAKAILVAYAGFTPEEAADLRNLSRIRVEETLRAHLERLDSERAAEQEARKAEAAAETESLSPEEILESLLEQYSVDYGTDS